MLKFEDVQQKVEELFRQYGNYEDGSNKITSINSVDYIKIVVALEMEYDFEFYDEDLADDRFESIRALAEYVFERIKEEQ